LSANSSRNHHSVGGGSANAGFAGEGSFVGAGFCRSAALRRGDCRRTFRPVQAGVRIYYLKTRFLRDFAMILWMQFCSSLAQSRRKFLAEWSIDDEKQKSKRRKTSGVAGIVEAFPVLGGRP
jgi:hypothetical protein